MSAVGIELNQPRDLWGETRAAMKDAVRSPGVLAVLIVCCTVVALALIAVVGWLAFAQRDAATLVGLVNTFVNVFLLKKVADVNGRVVSIERQTNGHTTRLMDAALSQKEN